MVKVFSISISDEAFERLEKMRAGQLKVNRSSFIEELIWSVHNDKEELLKKVAILRKLVKELQSENLILMETLKEFFDDDFDFLNAQLSKMRGHRMQLEKTLKELDGLGVKE